MNENTQPAVNRNNMAMAVAAMAEEVNQLQNQAQGLYQSVIELTNQNTQLQAELEAARRPAVDTCDDGTN